LEHDRWHLQIKYGPEYQLATTRTDFARVVANGQPLELHGDNLFLSLELSKENLPVGSQLQIGSARLQVTPMAHNGCKKWVQRFGLDAMQLNLAPQFKTRHLRGIYLQVIQSGNVTLGDVVTVVRRGS
jgi:MOSC domain-containing protein YiiM